LRERIVANNNKREKAKNEFDAQSVRKKMDDGKLLLMTFISVSIMS